MSEPKIRVIPAKTARITKNVAIYCRVSSNTKEQLNSLAAQISALTRMVSNVEQWNLCDTFIDVESAKTNSSRPEFERMLRACDEKQISVVLTKSISRFGRDTVETLRALQRLKAAGVRVIFEQEKLDTDSVDSDVMIATLEACAQAENESRSANIRTGLSHRAAAGTSGLYRRKLYGYDKDENGDLVINWEQAQVVREIFRLYLEGKSVLGIIRELKSRQIASPSGKERWNKKKIEDTLDNEKYTGTVRLLDSLSGACEYLVKDNHPPIITEDVFQRVREMRAGRSNVIRDENGTHRKHSKYSSKSKK